MKTRTFKWMALVVTGGIVLQLGGCWSIVVDLALNALVSQLVSQLTAL